MAESNSRRFGLDILRAAAVVGVLLLHSRELLPVSWPQGWLRAGWSGVDLFFVLSGYLVGSQALAPGKFSVTEFWVRRWVRTFPAYFLALAAYAWIKPALGFPFRAPLWPFFTFTQNYRALADFVQSWSLAIEEQFYFLLPLAVAFLGARRWPAYIWLGFAAISFAFRALAWYHVAGAGQAAVAFALQFPTHCHLDGLAAGVFLAATCDRWEAISGNGKRGLALAGAGIVFFSLSVADLDLESASTIWVFSSLAAGFALLIPFFASWEIAQGPVARLTTLIALLSYPLYLWNNLVFRLLAHAPLSPFPKVVAAMGVLSLVAATSYFGVERPALRKRDWLLGLISRGFDGRVSGASARSVAPAESFLEK